MLESGKCYEKCGASEGGNQDRWGHDAAILNGVVKVGLVEEVAAYVLVRRVEYPDM